MRSFLVDIAALVRVHQTSHHLRHQTLQHRDRLLQHLQHPHHHVVPLNVLQGRGHCQGVTQSTTQIRVSAQEWNLRIKLKLFVPPADMNIRTQEDKYN